MYYIIMKKLIITLLGIILTCAATQAQTLSVTTTLSKGSATGDVVLYGGVRHALQGAEATYNISLTTSDSIASITSFNYTFNNATKPVTYSLANGVASINPVIESNLQPTSADVVFECSLTYTTKRNDRDTTIVVNAAKGDAIHIYATPTQSIQEPTNYVYYKSANCWWGITASGGGEWRYQWTNDDGASSSASIYSYSGTNSGTSKKTANIWLTMTNYAPDGVTIWGERISKTYAVEIYPEATVAPSPKINYSFNPEELFQDQTWALSVSNSGGYPSGWTFEWKDESGNVVGTGSTYTMSSERSKENVSKHVTLTVTNKGRLTNGTEETWKQESYTWYATFVPCPVVEFAESYAHDMIFGDNMSMGFTIKNDDGVSLINDTKYNWSYLWNFNNKTSNNKTLAITANNASNSNGAIYTVTLTVSGTLDNGKKYETTRTHEVRMWPTPSISSPSATTTSLVACGGQTQRLSLTTFGGVKTGWTYNWYKGGALVQSSSEPYYDAAIVYDTKNKSTSIDSYSVTATNTCEGVSRFSETRAYSVTKYPRPVISDNINVYDVNRGTMVGTGIREGNTMEMSIDDCYGGYYTASSDQWTYSWTFNNGYSNSRGTTFTAPYSNYGSKRMNTATYTCSFNAANTYTDGTLWAVKQIDKLLTVYLRPNTPTALVKKGNGTSCTFIATANISDTELENYEYYLVFGYTDRNGTDHPQKEVRQQTGTIRFGSFTSSEFNDSNNRFWVYSLWKYDDGVQITSGKRYTDGVDDSWDGSAYTAAEISSRAFDNTADGIVDVYDDETNGDSASVYTLSGRKISRADAVSGVYIVNGKKILVK